MYDWLGIALEKSKKPGNPYHDKNGKFTSRENAYLYLGVNDGIIIRMSEGDPINTPASDEVLQSIAERHVGTPSATVAQSILMARQRAGGREAEQERINQFIRDHEQGQRTLPASLSLVESLSSKKPSQQPAVLSTGQELMQTPDGYATADTLLNDLPSEYNREDIDQALQHLGKIPTKATLVDMYSNLPGTKGIKAAVTRYDLQPSVSGTVLAYGVILTDADNKHVGELTRFITNDTIWASLVELAPEYQNTGIGLSMVFSEAAMVEKSGKTKIRCSPGLSVGGYLWGKMGFDYVDEQERKDQINNVAGVLDEIAANAIDFSELNEEQAGRIKQAVAAYQNGVLSCKHAWELSALRIEYPDDLGPIIKEAMKRKTANDLSYMINETERRPTKGEDKERAKAELRKTATIKLEAIEEGRLGKFLTLGTSWDAQMDLSSQSPGYALFKHQQAVYKAKAMGLLGRFVFPAA